VVALGNPMMAQDNFGPRVLQKLRAAELPGVDLLDAHTDLLAQIENFPSYELVILVDALLDPAGAVGAAGEVFAVDQSQLLSFPDDAASIHQISPVTAVKLFCLLHPDATTRFILVAYSTSEMTFSGALSDEIIEQASGLVRMRLASSL
jgi:hydrogenase maturation protease